MGNHLACGVSGLNIGWNDPARAVIVAENISEKGPPSAQWELFGAWVPVTPYLKVRFDDYSRANVLEEDLPVLDSWNTWAEKHKLNLDFPAEGVVADLKGVETPYPLNYQGVGSLRLAYISEHAWTALRNEYDRREANGNFLRHEHLSTTGHEGRLRDFACRTRPRQRTDAEIADLYLEQDSLRSARCLVLDTTHVRDALTQAAQRLVDVGESEDALLWLRRSLELKQLNTARDGLHWLLQPCQTALEVSENRVARRILRDLVTLTEKYDREKNDADNIDPWNEDLLHWKDAQ